MSDGLRLNPGADGELLATKSTILGHYQQIVLAYLDSGIPINITPTNKLPVVMDLSTLATAALQGTGNTKLDTIIAALAPLATEATVATLGTESTLATRISETTGANILHELDLVHHDPGAYPTTIPETVNFPSNYTRIGLGDGPAMDAFSRLRVSMPHTRFDSSQVYEKDRQFDELLTGGGTATFNLNRSAVQMVTTNSGDAVLRQSYEYIPYQPGKSQLVFMTFVAYGSVAGITSRVGPFDDSNGIFFEIADTVKVGNRTESAGAPVDTLVEQASWNLDPMDGTGPSGILLDIAALQIAVFDFEWLGGGRRRFGFVIDGLIHYVHEFNSANTDDKVWGLSGHLPVRLEITQTDVNPGQLDHICSTVISEGGEMVGDPRSYPNASGISVNNTSWTPVLSIRPKLLFQTLQNRKSLVIVKATCMGTSSTDYIMMRLVFGGTLTAASWALNPGSAYSSELDNAGTVNTGGIVVGSNMGGARTEVSLKSASFLNRIRAGLDINAQHPTTPYTNSFTMEARSIAASANVVSAFDWLERGP